jgi:hypothetical protein
VHRPGSREPERVLDTGIERLGQGLFKNTRVGERVTTQFHLEMFNAWNHTQFPATQHFRIAQGVERFEGSGSHDFATQPTWLVQFPCIVFPTACAPTDLGIS